MIPRYIIRPRNILTTPLLLKQALGARRTVAYPEIQSPRSNNYLDRHQLRTTTPNWTKDFFLTYPPGEKVHFCEPGRNTEQGTNLLYPGVHPNLDSTGIHLYRSIRAFSAATKADQRDILSREGFPTPLTATKHDQGRGLPESVRDLGWPSRYYIVRPLRHSRGQGWRLTEDPCDFIEGQEYIQAVYPKNHEYRVITVRGVPIITLLKRVPSELPRSQPWNHSNGSTFVTVADASHDRLRHTSIYDLVRSSRLLSSIDLAGIDIMYRRESEYAVTEVNLCPALTIPSNIEKVARHVHSLPQER